MKIIRSVLLVTTLAFAAISSAYAHDSFGFSINLGGPRYVPAPVYYPQPPVYYARPPVVYYQPAPPVYYNGYEGPRAYYRYDEPHFRHDYDRDEYHDRGFHHGWDRRGW